MNGTIQTLNPEALTWDTAIRFFSLRCKAQNLTAGTYRNYEITFRLFLRYLAENGNPKPAEITIHQLRGCIEAWKAAGRASETIDGRFRNLRAFFNYLLKDGFIITNPAAGLDRPIVARRLIRPFTQEQFIALLAQIRDNTLGLRDKALLLLLADTGLRISEALNIKIGELDLTYNTAIVMGKGRKERRVSWGDTTRKALISWLRVRPEAKDTEWAFCNQFGGPLVAGVFSRRVKDYTRKAGIAANRLSCHALRHFWACQYLKATGDIITLSRLLGHSSLDMSKKYLNLTDDEVLAKARQVGSVLDRMDGLPGGQRRVRVK